jgi:uncharacterized membrane protein (UPF0127 family)
MTTITDLTSGRVLSANAIVADSFWSRFRGWMLRGRPADGEALIIQPCTSIHMMFMRFAIDAVFFDREGNVTHVTHRLPPWVGLAFGRRRAYGVIELPAGAAQDIERGHRLLFEPGTMKSAA